MSRDQGMLSSLATLSLRPALQRPTDLPGGQPPGSADARFVRQATQHLCDAEGLAQLVTVASEVPTSEWEDPTTLKPAHKDKEHAYATTTGARAATSQMPSSSRREKPGLPFKVG